MRKLLAAVSFVVFAVAAGPASAWDGIKTGKLSAVDITSAQNFGVRAYLDGIEMCGTGSATWAFVNKSFDNYDVIVAGLMSAYLTGKTVTISMDRLAGNTCQLVMSRFHETAGNLYAPWPSNHADI